MGKVTLLTGGGRSGKSRYALELANGYQRKAFIATAEPFDGEMQERVARHQAERGTDFITVEEPLNLAEAIEGLTDRADVAIIDCLTVWLGNLMYHHGEDCREFSEVDEFLQAIQNPPCDLLIVTNEVGMGIIPADKLTRLYRDLAGSLNQRVSAQADSVIFMVSGLPLILKQRNEQ